MLVGLVERLAVPGRPLAAPFSDKLVGASLSTPPPNAPTLISSVLAPNSPDQNPKQDSYKSR